MFRVSSYAAQCLTLKVTPHHMVQTGTAHVKIQIYNAAENVIFLKVFMQKELFGITLFF